MQAGKSAVNGGRRGLFGQRRDVLVLCHLVLEDLAVILHALNVLCVTAAAQLLLLSVRLLLVVGVVGHGGVDVLVAEDLVGGRRHCLRVCVCVCVWCLRLSCVR